MDLWLVQYYIQWFSVFLCEKMPLNTGVWGRPLGGVKRPTKMKGAEITVQWLPESENVLEHKGGS